jgi:hypothetical protein
MSLLQFKARPWVVFDPSNKDHRSWYHQFVQHGTWGRCPYRFILPEDHGTDLITMCQRSLIKYYVTQEFGNPRAKSAQKTKKISG